MITGNRFRYSSGGGGKEKISELNDVDMGIPVETNDVLMYNGLGNWTNSAVLALNRVTVSELAPSGDDQLTRQDYVNKMAKSGFSPLVYTYNSTASATTITAIGGSVWNDITSIRIGFNPENVFDGVNAQTLMQNLILPFRINVQIGGPTFTLLCSTLSFDINYLICGVSFITGPTTSYPSNGTTAYVYFTPLTDLTNIQTQITNNDTDILTLQNNVSIANANTLKKSALRTYMYDQISVCTTSYNTYDSMTINYPTDYLGYIFLHCIFPVHQIMPCRDNATPKGIFYAVELVGVDWNGDTPARIKFGYANSQAMLDMTWVTSATVLGQTYVNESSSPHRRLVMFTANPSGVFQLRTTNSWIDRTTSGTVPSTAQEGDIITCGTTNNSEFKLQYYRTGVKLAECIVTHASSILSTLFSGPLYPVFNLGIATNTQKLKILSQREIQTLTGMDSLEQNIFY